MSCCLFVFLLKNNDFYAKYKLLKDEKDLYLHIGLLF